MMRLILFFTAIFLTLHSKPLAAASSLRQRIDVPQSTYAFGRLEKGTALEGTVSTCILVAIVDPQTKFVFFGHADGSNMAEPTLETALALFREQQIPVTRLRAIVAGGWKGWSHGFRHIRGLLNRARIRIQSYEAPVDIGYTQADSMRGAPIPL